MEQPRVVVWIPVHLRRLAGGARELSVEASNIAVLIDALARQHPALESRLRDETGQVHRFISLYVNGEDIRFLGGLEAPLAAGDVVSIVPAVSGG